MAQFFIIKDIVKKRWNRECEALGKIEGVTVGYESDHLLVWLTLPFASSNESLEFSFELELESLEIESLLESLEPML